MNSKEWSSDPEPATLSPGFYHGYLYKVLFLIPVFFVFTGCSKPDPFIVCPGDNCSYSSSTNGFIEITSEKRTVTKKILETGLSEVSLPGAGLFLAGYSHSIDRYLFRSIDENGIGVEIYRGTDEKSIEKIKLPSFIVSIPSACFNDNGNLWMLTIQEREGLPRKFVLSGSDEEYKSWENYLIREESDETWLKRIFSLGAPVERPVGISCGKEDVYVITHQYFQDTIQINVYRFDDIDRKLIYVTGYFPVEEKGKLSVYYSSESSTLYIFQNRRLITVTESLFPDTVVFDEPGEMFFSDYKEGVLLFFVPDMPVENKIKGRLIKKSFTDKISQ